MLNYKLYRLRLKIHNFLINTAEKRTFSSELLLTVGNTKHFIFIYSCCLAIFLWLTVLFFVYPAFDK